MTSRGADAPARLTLAASPLRAIASGVAAASNSAPAFPRRRWRRPRLSIPLEALGAGAASRPIREGDLRPELMLREAVIRRSLALADLVAAGLAVLVTVAAAGQQLRPAALALVPLVLFTGKLLGVYDRDEHLVSKATLDEAPRLLQLSTTITLLLVVFHRTMLSAPLGGGEILTIWTSFALATVLLRAAARRLAAAVLPQERCLLVGCETSAERLRAKFAALSGRVELVARMSIDHGSDVPDLEAAADALRDTVETLGIDRVIVEPSDPHPEATLDFVRIAKGTGARVSLLPRILDVVGSAIEVDDIDGLTLLGVRRFGLSRSSAILKRAFDIAGASAVLTATAPLLALIAVWILLDSRGPVIFRQTRIGRDGSPFKMWKFRTMVDGADAMKASLRGLNEAQGLFKIAHDPRITGAGRVLRKYSLDELPQLVNVLRGEMSLVGPRPLVADDDAQITGLDRRRLYLTPGMTGRWQILGSSRVPLPEMVKLDYLYVTGWSLWSDVKILTRTVPYVLRRRGQ